MTHASWGWEFSAENALANGGTGTGTYGGNSWFNLNNWDFFVDNALNQSAQVTTDSTTGYLLYGSIQNANGAGKPPWVLSNSPDNPPPLVNDPTNAFGFGAFDGQLFPYALATGTGSRVTECNDCIRLANRKSMVLQKRFSPFPIMPQCCPLATQPLRYPPAPTPRSHSLARNRTITTIKILATTIRHTPT